MAYNGSGTFNLFTPGNPVVTGTTISSTWANATLSDMATGLTTAVTKDGQTVTTGSIPFAAGISVGTYFVLDSSGNLAVTTNKFVVTAASGNTSVAGTLGVTGHTTFEGVTSTGATGTGKLVYDTSPVLVTPNLGTPSALVGTNITGTAAGLTAGAATTATTATSAATLTNARLINSTSFNGSANISLFNYITSTNLSSTSTTITGIPTTAKRVSIFIKTLSANSTGVPWLQFGVSGTPETSGYVGNGGVVSNGSIGYDFSSSVIIGIAGANYVYSGLITLTLVESSTNTWAVCGNLGITTGGPALFVVGGYKSLSGVLDSITLTFSDGTSTFDSGSVIVVYE